VGAVKLALQHKAPVVPVAIWGTENFESGLLSRPKVTIQIGQPLNIVEMAGPPPHDRETQRELTTVLMERIAGMLPPAYRGVYG
jgi:1-acyl-sn-glycerol-3-phosphate acyltransferase